MTTGESQANRESGEYSNDGGDERGVAFPTDGKKTKKKPGVCCVVFALAED